jgi:hypothetical protein
MLTEGKAIFAVLQKPNRISALFDKVAENIWVGLNDKEIEFAMITMEAGFDSFDTTYHQIPSEEDLAPSSFLSCLKRYAHSKGRTLQLEEVPDVLFGYKVESSSQSTELRFPALKLSLI